MGFFKKAGFAALVVYLGAVYLSAATALSAAATGAGIWDDLCSVRPSGMGVPVDGLVIVRDAFTFRLDSGAFFPLAPVSGRVVGGVFKGHGRFELKPASENERAFLALRAHQKDLKVLSDTLKEAVFFFTDETANQLLAANPSVPGNINDLGSVYDDILKASAKFLHADFRLRLVPDLVEAAPTTGGLFIAGFDGDKLPAAVALYIPKGLDAAWLDMNSGAETTALAVLNEEKGGIWYSDRPLTAQSSAPKPPAEDVAALHYSIETTIRKNTDIEGRTTLRLRGGRNGVRVVALDLFSKLRLSAVRLKKGSGREAEVPFIQGKEKSTDPVLVILPQPLASGEEAEIIAEYKGDEVLHDEGENNYYVGARENWYPDVNGFGDWATYDLMFRIPKKRQIVSVGRLVESSVDGDFAVYKYTSGAPFRAAGFNYGEFKLVEREDADSGVKVRVYTNPGEPNFIKGIREIIPNTSFSTEFAAQDTLADAINTARIGTVYYGPLLQNDIAVTQQTEWNFGQSWPTLIYIPYLAFLDWVTRAELGLSDAKSFVEEVTPHEFAHQWWGHRVGSATYRDAWLEEGLSEFTVSLVVERAQGPKAFREYWERARKVVLDRPLHSVYANSEAGPISMGRRLAIGETPQAYSAVVYRKGAFVIHMLRSILYDANDPNHDHRFMEMMQDFLANWGGKNPTTADFQAVVERHAPQPFTWNMGWFFRQWVEGTALPKIESNFTVEAADGGKYRIKGSLTQSGVPDDFVSLVPLYLDFGKDKLVRFALARMQGSRTLPFQGELALPRKPVRVVANPNFECLTDGK